MRYCENCKVYVAGNANYCPLCEGCLAGEVHNKIEAFPNLSPHKRKRFLLFKILIFCSVLVSTICFAINLNSDLQNWWMNYVLAGLASFWIVLGIIVKKHKNPAKAVLWFSIISSLVILLWDLATGFSCWSINFVLPVLYIFTTMLIVILVRFMHLKPQSYIFYLLLNIILGFIPLILYFFNILDVIYPSTVCAAINIIAMASLIIFQGDVLKEELDRRLHI